jgi:hypothetical protein
MSKLTEFDIENLIHIHRTGRCPPIDCEQCPMLGRHCASIEVEDIALDVLKEHLTKEELFIELI